VTGVIAFFHVSTSRLVNYITLLNILHSEFFCRPIVQQFLANVNSGSRSLYVVVRPSVVCLSSVTFVHPTQAIEIFGNVSTPFGTLATDDLSVKNFTEIIPGEPLRWGS